MNNKNNLLPQNVDEIHTSHRYTTVIGAFLALFALGIVISSFSVYFKPISAQFGWTRAETSGVFSVSFIISGLIAITLGRLAEKFSYQLVILSCGVLAGCTCILMSQMNALWQYYFYFGGLIGVATASIIPITSLVTKSFSRQRGLMTGISISGGAIASIISAPIITKLIDIFDWRTSFIIMGVAVLLITFVSAIFLRNPVRSPSADKNNAAIQKNKIKVVSENNLQRATLSGKFWILGSIFFCLMFAQQMILVHLIPHLTDIGISPIIAASILSVISAGNAAGNFSTGRINDIVGSKRSMIGGIVILFLALLLFVVTDKVWVFYVFAVLFGLGWGGTVMLRSVIVADMFGLHSHATITGAILLISNIGGAISPLIAGYIFDISGGYLAAFFLSIGFTILALVMALLMRYKKRSNKQK